VSVLPTGSRRFLQRPLSTAGWRSRGPSGHPLNTNSPSGATRRSRRRDGAPERWIPPTGSVRPGLWRSSGLVDRQNHQEAGPGTTFERGRVPQVPGTDLGEGVLTHSALQNFIRWQWSSSGPGRVRFFIGRSPTGQTDWAGRSQGRSRSAGGTSAIPPAEP